MAMPQNLKLLAQIFDRVKRLSDVDLKYLVDWLEDEKEHRLKPMR